MKKLLLAVFIVFSLQACNDNEPFTIPSSDLTPVQGETERNKLAAEYSRGFDHAALLIYRNDQLVFEEYGPGAGGNITHAIFSGTKSFNCAMGVQAITDGLLASFDEVVSNTITEWANDARRSTITVRQLLNMTSGIYQDLPGFLLFPGNKHAFAVAQTGITEPGAVFSYGELHMSIFAELMRRKLKVATGESPLAYLTRRVFDPIGLSYTSWVTDAVGNAMMSFGALMTARNWAKYGQLLKDNGDFGGANVLDPVSLAECMTGSAVMPAYGLSMWLNKAVSSEQIQTVLLTGGRPTFSMGTSTGLLYGNGPGDIVELAGYGDNRIYFSPSRNIMAVRLGRGSLLSNWKDARFLARLFDGVRL